ncbi:MAG: glycosyltransferase family 4 protein [Acidobacteria bacterium]|nr:glycosyltransferase family 4 protein [Acidobacteriota bacterium]
MPKQPAALVLYHYLYPDDVVSSVHLTELATGLVARGWQVTASAGNRGCRDESQTYPLRSEWHGVQFRRIWRPRFRQASSFGRIANAVWMIVAWSLLALDPRVRPDVIIMGTDPILSPLVALFWRVCRPNVRIVHWCFDLFPEAAIVDGLLREGSAFVRLVKWLLERAYACCDLIVDIGACMRTLLQKYGSRAAVETIPPWALAEPAGPAQVDEDERASLFGDASLGLLYSGNFGRAHTWQGIPELAEVLAPLGGRVAFSVRGNGVEALKTAFDQIPVHFAGFASSDRLEARLGAADVHIVSLREDWTGTVVPSKFFGALAMGRPVLFIGSEESALARWIRELGVGWVLAPETMSEVMEELLTVARSARTKETLFSHCQQVYHKHFSRDLALDRWDAELRRLVEIPSERAVPAQAAAGRR